MRTGWDSWKHRGVAFIGGHPSSECTGLFSWPHTSNIDMQWIWLTLADSHRKFNAGLKCTQNCLDEPSAKNSDGHPWVLHAKSYCWKITYGRYMQIQLDDNPTHCDRIQRLCASVGPALFSQDLIQLFWLGTLVNVAGCPASACCPGV